MTSKDIKHKYDESYYLREVEGWQKFANGEIDERKKAISEMIDVKGKIVLDIGYARGELLQCCHKTGAICYGLDYSQAAYEVAREFCDPEILLKVGEMTKPFDWIRKIDVVFLIDVVEHIDITENAIFLDNIKQALNDDAVLIGATPVDIKRGDSRGEHICQWYPDLIKKEYSKIFKIVIVFQSGSNYLFICTGVK
jgi:2-polyprenyl-3-methyl-5-hydroxy-6-metoxy-1,4-benzoquinol methylase